MLKTRMALALVVLGTLAAGAALAQSPTPAGPIGISPTGQPRGYTLRFEPYQITGWGRARFGMSEAEVRAAIAQEFPDAGPVAQTTEPSQGTLVLTVVVPKAEPGPGPATISYVFGASSRTLAAVNVSWLAPGDATPAQRRALIAAGSELLAGLLGSYWAPLTTARGHVLAPGVVILFASRDPQGHGIEVRLDGVPLDLQRPSSNGVPRPLERMVAPPGSARLRLSVVADPLRPDVPPPALRLSGARRSAQRGVARSTSSMVVRPSATFIAPARRSGRRPSATRLPAQRRRQGRGCTAPGRLVDASSSYRPTRPR